MEMDDKYTYQSDFGGDKVGYQQPVKKHTMSTVAGILLIVAGAIGIICGIFYASLASMMGSFFPDMMGAIPDYNTTGTMEFETFFDWYLSIFIICGIVMIIFSIFALLGGILSLKRKMWGIAITCSVLGLFSYGFLVSSILSLVALILIAISKEEFEQRPGNI
jgi:MFS family permease